MTGGRSPILQSTVTFLFFLVNVFAVYLLLRGHNFPGGGFIGGLGSALSLILLTLAIGIRRVEAHLRFDPVTIAALGLALAFLTGALPLLLGEPFLRHWNVKLYDVPVLGEVFLGTPLLFDIGVYLTVVGVACKLIFVLARAVEGVGALSHEEGERYASAVEEPIEPALPAPREEGDDD
jgi:multisubunit Na+/H+ antiporter MnhB subunit